MKKKISFVLAALCFVFTLSGCFEKKVDIEEYLPGKYFISDDGCVIKFYKYNKKVYLSIPLQRVKELESRDYTIENGKIIINFQKENIDDDTDRLDFVGSYSNGTLSLKGIWRDGTENRKEIDPWNYTETEIPSVELKNIQPTENIMDYKTAILLRLRYGNLDKDDALDEYAKIFHKNDYAKYRNDQFEWHDKIAEIKKEYEQVTDALKENVYTCRFEIPLSDYNFNRGGFHCNLNEQVLLPIAFMDNFGSADEIDYAYLEAGRFSVVNFVLNTVTKTKNVFGTAEYKRLKYFIPMSKEEAKEFSEKHATICGVCYFSIQDKIKVYTDNFSASEADEIYLISEKMDFYDSMDTMNKLTFVREK